MGRGDCLCVCLSRRRKSKGQGDKNSSSVSDKCLCLMPSGQGGWQTGRVYVCAVGKNEREWLLS